MGQPSVGVAVGVGATTPKRCRWDAKHGQPRQIGDKADGRHSWLIGLTLPGAPVGQAEASASTMAVTVLRLSPETSASWRRDAPAR